MNAFLIAMLTAFGGCVLFGCGVATSFSEPKNQPKPRPNDDSEGIGGYLVDVDHLLKIEAQTQGQFTILAQPGAVASDNGSADLVGVTVWQSNIESIEDDGEGAIAEATLIVSLKPGVCWQWRAWGKRAGRRNL